MDLDAAADPAGFLDRFGGIDHEVAEDLRDHDRMAVDGRHLMDRVRDPDIDDRRAVGRQQALRVLDDRGQLHRLEPALIHAEGRMILQDLLDMTVLLGDDPQILGKSLAALEHGLHRRFDIFDQHEAALGIGLFRLQVLERRVEVGRRRHHRDFGEMRNGHYHRREGIANIVDDAGRDLGHAALIGILDQAAAHIAQLLGRGIELLGENADLVVALERHPLGEIAGPADVDDMVGELVERRHDEARQHDPDDAHHQHRGDEGRDRRQQQGGLADRADRARRLGLDQQRRAILHGLGELVDRDAYRHSRCQRNTWRPEQSPASRARSDAPSLWPEC